MTRIHAGFRARDEGLGELRAGVAVLEDVRLEMDVVARGGDGREHRAVGLGAILAECHAVADTQRVARQRFLDRRMALEESRVRRFPAQRFEDCAALVLRKVAVRALQSRGLRARFGTEEIPVDGWRRAGCGAERQRGGERRAVRRCASARAARSARTGTPPARAAALGRVGAARYGHGGLRYPPCSSVASSATSAHTPPRAPA